MHGLVVLCGSVKGLSRDSQGTIKVALGVLWRLVWGFNLGSIAGPLRLLTCHEVQEHFNLHIPLFRKVHV